MPPKERTYLKVRDDLAESVAHEPGLRDVPHDRGREAEEDDEKVRDGQVHDEHVRHRPHGVVPVDGQADEEVAHEAHEEDEAVEAD